jgi:hypothetical protein
MSKAQRKKLRAKGRQHAILWGFGFAWFLIIAVDQIFFARRAYDSETIHTLVNIGLLIAWLILGFGTARLLYQPYQADLYKAKVDHLTGRVHLKVEQKGRAVAYRLMIRRTTFELSKEVFLSFSGREDYVIYYVPNSRTILSAEKIGNV